MMGERPWASVGHPAYRTSAVEVQGDLARPVKVFCHFRQYLYGKDTACMKPDIDLDLSLTQYW